MDYMRMRPRQHPPPDAAVHRYSVRLAYVLGRLDGLCLNAMYGLPSTLSDGVDPGCLDAPEWMPAGGMESYATGGRQEIVWRRGS